MTSGENDTAASIRTLLAEKLLVEVDSTGEDLLDAGVLDSLALIQLLFHLEERFNVTIPLDELEIEDLRSIASIARMVENQRALKTQTRVAVEPQHV